MPKPAIEVVAAGGAAQAYASAFAVADIRPLGSAASDAQLLADVVLPVNGRVEQGEVRLAPGVYSVRARLPNGETLVEQVVAPKTSEASTLVVSVDAKGRARDGARAVGRPARPPEDVGFLAPPSPRGNSGAVRGSWSRTVLAQPLESWLLESGRITELMRSEGVNPSTDGYVLHRLRAAAPDSTLRVLRDPDASAGEAARSMFGTAVAIQPTQVRRVSKNAPPTSTWRVGERGRVESAVDAVNRYYGVLMATSEGAMAIQKVASIPDRWIGMDGSVADVFQAEVLPHPDLPGAQRVELSVSDPQASSLLSFLQSGDLNGALAVASPAMGFVEEDLTNAHAAVAAAYALVFAPEEVVPKGWEQRVLRLADARADIPDGKILEATLLLQRRVDTFFFDGRRFPAPTVERRLADAWECVQEAMRRGPPVFRLGLQLLESNLRILRDADSDAVDQRTAAGAARVTAWLRARVDPYQPLCVFDVS